MPLLICPNCQTGMKEIDRNSVRIDICPQCRGVWLDRGELERFLEPVRQADRDYDRDSGGQERYRSEPHHQSRDYHKDQHKRRKSPWRNMLDVFD